MFKYLLIKLQMKLLRFFCITLKSVIREKNYEILIKLIAKKCHKYAFNLVEFDLIIFFSTSYFVQNWNVTHDDNI